MLRESRDPPSALRYRALDAMLQRGLLPDGLLRAGSYAGSLIRERRELRGGPEATEQRLQSLVQLMREGPIAQATEAANEQHYEMPPELFGLMLGPRYKYSGCLWEPGVESLAQAEEAMLTLTCKRAQVLDGMRVLDLGCGWGSLTLWLAERYPGCRITAVSNSGSQRRLIEARCAERRAHNVEVITADVNSFEPEGTFHRVISVEMFEHMRNWQELLRRISGWLSDDGRLFVHTFSHRSVAYRFEATWAAERFFTAGLMPSHDLPLHFQDDLRCERRWALAGTHYARTLQEWRRRLDAHAEEAIELLTTTGHSHAEARRILGTWRLFLISTAVMWGRDHGRRWLISHYRFAPRSHPQGAAGRAGAIA